MAYSSSAIFMGGYMKDPTLSPVAPAGTKFPFIGAMVPSTQVWIWLLVDATTIKTPVVKALQLSGSSLLVVLEDANPGTLVMEVNTATGLRKSPTVIQILNYKPPTMSAAYVGTSKAVVIASNGTKSILAELDLTQSIFKVGASNVRFLADANNSINMHNLMVFGSYIYIAQTATMSSTLTPTTSLPAVSIEMVNMSSFSTSALYVIHCACFSSAGTAYPMVSQLQMIGSYSITGALTFQNSSSMTQVHIFSFTRSSLSPYAITSSTIKSLPG